MTGSGIAFRTLDTVVGEVLVAATSRGLVRLAFAFEGFDDVLAGLVDDFGPVTVDAADQLEVITRQLDEYFRGDRREFTLPLGVRSAGFRGTVLDYLPQVVYGSTSTYGAVAAAVGRPGAARAVGSACAANPVPIVVPCHRILHADGTLGGYLGGLDVKASLLELESAA